MFVLVENSVGLLQWFTIFGLKTTKDRVDLTLPLLCDDVLI